MSEGTTRAGISFISLLCLLFIGLKITGYISWSWWLIMLPVIIPFLFAVLFLMAVLFIAIFA